MKHTRKRKPGPGRPPIADPYVEATIGFRKSHFAKLGRHRIVELCREAVQREADNIKSA